MKIENNIKNKFTIDIPITTLKVVTIKKDMTKEELRALIEKDPVNFFETKIYENESLELLDEYIEEDGLLYDETDVQIFQKRLVMETQIVRIRPKYDNSTKEFEILYKHYVFDKYTRKLDKEYPWRHERYYKTLQNAKDAVRDFRNSYYDKIYRDYPAMGDVEREKEYPHIKPVINLKRYKIIRRVFQ